MSDADADAAMGAFIEKLRRFGAEGLDLAAREAQPLVEAEAKRTAGAGTDPYGEPWRPTKAGARAIPNAAGAVEVIVRGATLTTRAHGGAAIQNVLSDKNRRQVIPDAYRGLPPGYREALQEGARRAFRKLVGSP